MPSITDASLKRVRSQALSNRGKPITYKELSGQSIDFETGEVTQSRVATSLIALVSGVKAEDKRRTRTFRVLADALGQAPTLKAIVTYGGRDYEIVGWSSDQSEIVYDLLGVEV